jgi:hypothetical protein
MTGLCKYRDINGRPGEAQHAKRIGAFALFDVLVSIACAALTAYLFNWNFAVVLTLIIIAGILVHRLFCVNTALNVMIFGEIP